MSRAPQGFRITSQKGFHLTFANGWTVSVQFGPGNYCDHRDRDIGREEAACAKEGSLDAEVACWPADGEMCDLGNDTVAGYVSADDVARLIHEVANLPTDATAVTWRQSSPLERPAPENA